MEVLINADTDYPVHLTELSKTVWEGRRGERHKSLVVKLYRMGVTSLTQAHNLQVLQVIQRGRMAKKNTAVWIMSASLTMCYNTPYCHTPGC